MKLTNVIAEIYADEAIEEKLSDYYDDPVIGFNQFTAKEIVKMYHDAVVVDKPNAKKVKAFKKFPCKKGLCHVNVYFGSKLMKNYKCMKGFAHDHGSWKAHSWAIHRGNIIETTPVKRNAYYGIEIECDDLEQYVRDDEKKKFDDYMKSESLAEANIKRDTETLKMIDTAWKKTNAIFKKVLSQNRHADRWQLGSSDVAEWLTFGKGGSKETDCIVVGGDSISKNNPNMKDIAVVLAYDLPGARGVFSWKLNEPCKVLGKTYDTLIAFEHNSDSHPIREDVWTHEFVHYLDWQRHGDKANFGHKSAKGSRLRAKSREMPGGTPPAEKSRQDLYTKGSKLYYTSAAEYNAIVMAGIKLIKKIFENPKLANFNAMSGLGSDPSDFRAHHLSTMKTFMKLVYNPKFAFWSSRNRFIKYTTDSKYRRKFLKRMAGLYEYLVDKYTFGLDEEKISLKNLLMEITTKT